MRCCGRHWHSRLTVVASARGNATGSAPHDGGQVDQPTLGGARTLGDPASAGAARRSLRRVGPVTRLELVRRSSAPAVRQGGGRAACIHRRNGHESTRINRSELSTTERGSTPHLVLLSGMVDNSGGLQLCLIITDLADQDFGAGALGQKDPHFCNADLTPEIGSGTSSVKRHVWRDRNRIRMQWLLLRSRNLGQSPEICQVEMGELSD